MTLLRNMLFVPGYRKEFLDKSATLHVDALILDLEDSVPFRFKKEARENIREFLANYSGKAQIFIRLNSLSSDLLDDDLNCVLCEAVDGFMPSMINDEDDLVRIDRLIGKLEDERGFEKGRFKLCPLIETCSAVLRSYEIGRCSSRIVGLAFGGQDFLTDIGGLNMTSGMSILHARSTIVLAAKALGLEAIDTPYLKVRDIEGFSKAVDFARGLGFSGTLILHPSQIQVANDAFTPSRKEVEEALEIIKIIEASGMKGEGVALLNGRLIGPPMELRAKNILANWKKVVGRVGSIEKN